MFNSLSPVKVLRPESGKHSHPWGRDIINWRY